MNTEESKVEVMEVRLYLENGKLVNVEGIDEKKYKTTDCELPNETGIQQAFSVLTQHNSPGCLIWSIERTRTGYKKVCLVWV